MSATATSSVSRPASDPLGVFGGTFDPVHFGHLRLAEEAREHLQLAAVRWIPAGRPPHRASPGVEPAHRLAMVGLAIDGNPHFAVDGAEVESTAPSYTVLTLERLRAEAGSRPLVLLVGADAFAGLATWHRWRELFDLAHIAVFHRPGFPVAADRLPGELGAQVAARLRPDKNTLGQSAAGAIVSFAMTQLAISATQIRHLLAHRASARYLLPQPVLDYIERHHLYRNS